MNGNTLYKYRSLYKEDGSLNKFTWKLLFNGEIYLSDFESLNDPCEGQIIPRYRDITKEKILKIHPWLATMPYFNDIDWKSEEVVTRIQDILTPSIKEKLKKYGVFCVSSDCENDLLWAHYADSHKGICVGFDIDKLEKISGYKIYPVKPEQKRPEVEFSDDESHYKNFLIKMLTTKPMCWKYEKEYRMVALSPQKRNICCFGAIKEIYLGCRIEKNKNFNREDFIRRLKKVHPLCVIKEMRVNIDTLKIESHHILSK